MRPHLLLLITWSIKWSIQLETNDLNPLPEVVAPGVEETRDQSNYNLAPGTTIEGTVEQVNPLLYPHSSNDKEYMESLIPEKRNALLSAEKVIGRTTREVEAGQRPLSALKIAS